MGNKNQHKSTDSTLNPQQLAVIEAWASGASKAEAARSAGVDRTTIYVWLRDNPEFAAQFDLARLEQTDAIRARLGGLAEKAVETISEIMANNSLPPALRLSCIRVISSFGRLVNGSTAAVDLQKSQPNPLRNILSLIGRIWTVAVPDIAVLVRIMKRYNPFSWGAGADVSFPMDDSVTIEFKPAWALVLPCRFSSDPHF